MAVLDLRVNVDVKGAQKLDGLGDNLKGIGKGMTAAVTLPLIGIGAAALSAAEDAEKSQARMQAVFDNIGAAAWTSIEALEAHGQAMTESTTFDDESIRDAQAALLTFDQITGDVFTRATENAADLAAFFETDMETAALTLGKALQDPIAGLSKLGRQGIVFTEEQKEVIASMVAVGDTAGAQALILDEVQRQVGTVAEELADTTGGQMAQAMNKLGDAGEALGVFLLPVLSAVAGALSGMADAWLKLPGPVQGVIAAVLGIVAIVGPVLWVVGMVVSSMGSIIGAFKAVGLAFKALSLLLLANPFVALAAAVIALVALIVLNWDAIVDVFKGALRWMKQTGEKLWTPLSEGFKAAIGAIKGVWNAFAGWWNRLAISVPTIDIPFVGKVGGFTIDLPDLPMLAEGGIVNRPTLALIGESGPEAVVPLDGRHGVNGPAVTINFNGNIEEDDKRRLPGELLRGLYVAGVS